MKIVRDGLAKMSKLWDFQNDQSDLKKNQINILQNGNYNCWLENKTKSLSPSIYTADWITGIPDGRSEKTT